MSVTIHVPKKSHGIKKNKEEIVSFLFSCLITFPLALILEAIILSGEDAISILR